MHLYYKIPKIYLSYHIISIRSHFRKWPWRDWQPLYCVGCEFLFCSCRCVGLLRSLLLDWYLGSQKLREILTLLLLHHPFLFKGKPTHAEEVACVPQHWEAVKETSAGPTTHQGAPLCLVVPMGLLLCAFSAHKVSSGPKNSPKSFTAFGLRLVLIFCEVKNKQKRTTGTRHCVNRLVQKMI